MFRALGISIIAHLLLLSFFYERMLDHRSVRNDGPAIQAEIVPAGSATGFEAQEPVPQVVQQIEQQKGVKKSAKIAPSPEEVAVVNQAVSSQSLERSVAVDGLNERHSEIVPPVVRPISQDGLRQYGINVAKEARKYKHFPSMARQRGWEGEVSVVIGTAVGTLQPVVSLNKGSGFDALDHAALEMVRAAVRDAHLPEVLYGRAFALTLPIRYSLED